MSERYEKSAQLYATYDALGSEFKAANTLLELGVRDGDSLRRWATRHPHLHIVGIDINPSPPITGAVTYESPQQDIERLSDISEAEAPDGWDIIIDDASHIGKYTAASFMYLFRYRLKPGGLYVIEDWQTGYDPRWPDGKRLERTNTGHRVPSLATGWHSRLRRTARRISTRATADSHPWRVGSAVVRRTERLLVTRTFDSHNAGMVGVVKQIIDQFSTNGSASSVIHSMTFTPEAVIVRRATDQQ